MPDRPLELVAWRARRQADVEAHRDVGAESALDLRDAASGVKRASVPS